MLTNQPLLSCIHYELDGDGVEDQSRINMYNRIIAHGSQGNHYSAVEVESHLGSNSNYNYNSNSNVDCHVTNSMNSNTSIPIPKLIFNNNNNSDDILKVSEACQLVICSLLHPSPSHRMTSTELIDNSWYKNNENI